MKRKALKVISMVLCLLLMFSITAFAVIESQHEDAPENSKYNIISNYGCNISISGINSTSTARLQANSSVSLSITMELQKLKSGSYSTIETWNSSKTGTVLTMEESRLINIFATYRLKVTFTAGSETVTSYAYPS